MYVWYLIYEKLWKILQRKWNRGSFSCMQFWYHCPFIAILNLFGTKYDEQILFISFTKKQIIFKHLKHKRYLLLCSFRITTIYMYIIHFCTLSTLILGVYVFYHYVWYFYYSPDGVIWYFFFLIWIWDQCRSVLM